MGLSQYFDKNHFLESIRGTRNYMAPELLMGFYDHKVDIWACGVIFYGLLTGKFPFPTNCSYSSQHHQNQKLELRKKIMNTEVNYDLVRKKGVGENVVDLLKKMLEVDPRRRPEASQLLKNYWFHNSVEKSDYPLGLSLFLVKNQSSNRF